MSETPQRLTPEQIEEYREWLGKPPTCARAFTGRLICDLAIAALTAPQPAAAEAVAMNCLCGATKDADCTCSHFLVRQPTDSREVVTVSREPLMKLAAWNKRYPSGRVYDYGSAIKMERELQEAILPLIAASPAAKEST